MKSKSFHHGNLREELIKAAMQALNEKGIEGLSLRSIAQDLCVSSAAPFKHFKNKDELIKALALEAGDRMARQYEKIKRSELKPDERLSLACMSYLDCAEKTPHAFKLMFADSNSFLDFRADPVTQYQGYKLFEEFVKDLIPSDAERHLIREVTISCWALLHGYATLHMSALLETVDYKKDRAVAAVISLAKNSNSLSVFRSIN